MNLLRFLPAIGISILTAGHASTDWPMWRHDPGRTAATEEQLPEKLFLQWTLKLPQLVPAYKDLRLQFDKGYEPIVTKGRLIIGSSRSGGVTAYDAEKGNELWRFYTEGPVRFAPASDGDRVFVGSDDGFLYCLSTSSGKLLWKFRGSPSKRKVLGNGHMISLWPVRGGPVTRDGKVWFAAGVWPMEGVFIHCLDARTGKSLWINDSCGFLYGQQPHNAQANGGLAPQGYLLLDGDDLIVPSSVAFPARLDAFTGKLKEFELPAQGRLPGGWFASTPAAKEQQRLKRRGLLFDSDVNKRRHEDKERVSGQPGIRATIHAGDRVLRFGEGMDGVSGESYEMLVANGRLYVVTVGGEIHCLSGKEAVPLVYQQQVDQGDPRESDSLLSGIRKASGFHHGHALVLGMSSRWMGLLQGSSVQLVGVGKGMNTLRGNPEFEKCSLSQLTLFEENPLQVESPPYFASLIVVDESAAIEWSKDSLDRIYKMLRPFGGSLCVIGSNSSRSAFRTVVKTSKFPGAQFTEHEGFSMLRKAGALPGSTNYLGDWGKSPDEQVRFPLGILWFGDDIGHFKRSPQPKFVDGVMVSASKNWVPEKLERTREADYRLLPAVLSDVYTGRVMEKGEATAIRELYGKVDLETLQPSQFRPPKQKDAWKPGKPRVGERQNPLTGEMEPRVFPKSYGCDGGLDYGHLYTMRSATAAYYDKRIESGTINLSGPRSGCTNSVIPANGLLNVPYYYEGCTCSYPLPMAMSLVSMPQTHEQWTSWGEVELGRLNGKVRRLGVNLGAPGDRATEAGTLWLDFPSVGGPSPTLPIKVLPEDVNYRYYHSLRVKGGRGWPWVAASCAEGLASVRIKGLATGQYTVRLTFIEPDQLDEGERLFDILLQGRNVLGKYDIAKSAGGSMRAVVETIEDVAVEDFIHLRFRSIKGKPILSGLELIRENLPIPKPITLEEKGNWDTFTIGTF